MFLRIGTLTLALVFMSVSCSGKEKKATEKPSANKKETSADSNSAPDFSSPNATLKTLFAALKAQNKAFVIQCYSEELGKEAKGMREKDMAAMSKDIDNLNLAKVEMQGPGKATIKATHEDYTETITFMKQDGRWVISSWD